MEANQDIPTWLQQMYSDVRHGGGSARRPTAKSGRFSSSFGARDYRQQSGGGGGGPPRSAPSRPNYGGKGFFFVYIFLKLFTYLLLSYFFSQSY